MKLTPCRCPTCGRDVRYLFEKMTAVMPLEPVNADGTSDIDGDRGVALEWDTIEPDIENGKVTVSCGKYHQWLAELQP